MNIINSIKSEFFILLILNYDKRINYQKDSRKPLIEKQNSRSEVN